MSDGEEKSWWGSWVKSAKEKSMSALTMVKKDLTEFGSVMQEDTIKAASKVKEKLTQENANAATEKVKQGMTNLIGGISRALVIEPDDSYVPARIVGGEAIMFDRSKARLHALQIDPTTYTTDPLSERYQEWSSNMNLDDMKGDISELLVCNAEVRALYTQLVPCTVSNVEFWRRYYFKRLLLEEEEARRVELMKRAEDANEQKDLGWDEDDDDWSEARALSAHGESKDAKLTSPTASSSLAVSDQHEAGFATVSLIPVSLDSKLNEEEDSETSLSADNSELTPSDVVAEEKMENVETEETRAPEPLTDACDVDNGNKSNESGSDNNSVEASVINVGDVVSLTSGNSSEPSLSGWSGLSDVKSSEDDSTKVVSLEKLIVVDEPSSGCKTPSEDSSNTKESLDDEWEKDFDVEVTEEDLQAAQNSLKKITLKEVDEKDDGPDNWEDW